MRVAYRAWVGSLPGDEHRAQCAQVISLCHQPSGIGLPHRSECGRGAEHYVHTVLLYQSPVCTGVCDVCAMVEKV